MEEFFTECYGEAEEGKLCAEVGAHVTMLKVEGDGNRVECG